MKNNRCSRVRLFDLPVFVVVVMIVQLLLHRTVAVRFTTATTTAFVGFDSKSQRRGAFVPKKKHPNSFGFQLHAIAALVKKAKLAELQTYIQNGVPDSILQKYKQLQEATSKTTTKAASNTMGSVQEALTRRKGTITIITEYKRKLSETNTTKQISELYDPEIVSPVFREYGATAISVLADERMGGCGYDVLEYFIEEQRRAKSQVPGPVPILNSDVIVDELQIARSADMGVAGIVLSYELVGADILAKFLAAAEALDLESIVAVNSFEQAQHAIDLGARMIRIDGNDEDEKIQILHQINDNNQDATVTKIATVLAQLDPGLSSEIEQAWKFRDAGFHAAWVGEALYKAGTDPSNAGHPGAVIRAMKSKSSLKWASPMARTGRGEGAREYLGDILM
jgi:indole-3-glycerol phosphate synthase